MEPVRYLVIRIDGDYAVLVPEEGGAEFPMAMALLPDGVDQGTRLLWEDFTYTIL